MRGRLIVLEGIDGSGKTTLARGIARELEARGHRVVSTREPTDGPYGKRIREVAARSRESITAEEELELFHKDRAEHVNRVVRPALEAGAIVVQDRSYFSTVAYQGERGLDRAKILAESEKIAPVPDLLLVVDVPAEDALERIRSSRGTPTDDFEKLDSLERVRRVFLALPKAQVLDGRLGVEALLKHAMEVVDRLVSS